MPNVGKSTLFNALLKKQQALAANYPFATIEPNVGIVPVPDARLNALAAVVETTEGVRPPLVPATVEFVDIAGIVAGAHKGEGLGNQFLSHIREVDAIAQVVRDFSDADVVDTGSGHVADFETVTSELILRDLATIRDQATKLSKDRSKEGQQRQSVIGKLEAGFNQGFVVRQILSEPEMVLIKDWWLLTAKPRIVVINTSESGLADAEATKARMAELLGVLPELCVVVSAKIESELSLLSPEEESLYLQELKIKESGLSRLITTAYHQLGLQSFLTAGEKEVRAWTIVKGMKAPEAAGVIHTDFSKKFIKAEVADWQDFVAAKGWKGVREMGKLRLEGKEYLMRDGDVVEFKIGS